MTIGLVLTLLLTTGVRVYVHAHPTGFAPATEHAHVHVGNDTVAFYASADLVDVSFSAIQKIFSLYPAVALLAVLLPFALVVGTGTRARRLPSASLSYRDPPYLAPPGRGPPQ